MTIKSKLNKICILSLVFMMAAASVIMAAENKRVEIYLDYTDVTLNVYKIGTYDDIHGTRTAILTEEFAASGSDIDRIWDNASAIHDVASELEAYVKTNRLAPYREKVEVNAFADEPGKKARALVEDMEDGVYLYIKSSGSSRITITPFILTMPYYDKEASDWLYDIKVYPKCDYHSNTSGNPSGSSGTPPSTTTITPSDVPLEDSPILVPIEDPEVPLIGLPKMGDLGLSGYLMAAFVFGSAGLATLRKGRKYNKEDENR